MDPRPGRSPGPEGWVTYPLPWHRLRVRSRPVTCGARFGEVKVVPSTHAGPLTRVPSAEPIESPTTFPVPSFIPQRATRPLPVVSSFVMPLWTSASERARFHTRASSSAPSKKPKRVRRRSAGRCQEQPAGGARLRLEAARSEHGVEDPVDVEAPLGTVEGRGDVVPLAVRDGDGAHDRMVAFH